MYVIITQHLYSEFHIKQFKLIPAFIISVLNVFIHVLVLITVSWDK